MVSFSQYGEHYCQYMVTVLWQKMQSLVMDVFLVTHLYINIYFTFLFCVFYVLRQNSDDGKAFISFLIYT